MRKRTQAREYALKILYQVDIIKEPYRDIVDKFWLDIETEDSIKEFANSIVSGVMENIANIDQTITDYATDY